jgi:hypothetical protein
MLRPARTALAETGIARMRSVTPLAVSFVTATTNDSIPNSIVMASMPGIRKSM